MQVARILTDESRSDAVVARYGGDEFVVILPSCGRESAVGVTERLRWAVELGPWNLRPITVSIDIATMTDSTLGRAVLIAQADAAMYQAKVNGRNQVCSNCDD